MLDFSKRLHALLSAPYPCVFLQTHEEERALTILTQTIETMGRTVSVWRPEDDPSRDPGDAFEQALRAAATGGGKAGTQAVTIFCDAHPYLRTPARERALRAAASDAMKHGSTLVFVAAAIEVPYALTRDAVTIDLPLPDREELERILLRSVDAAARESQDPERLSLAALGLTAREALRAFRRAAHVAHLARLTRKEADWEAEIIAEKRRLIGGAGALDLDATALNLESVGGLGELKRWTDERRRAFSDEARRFGLPQPRGVLLIGVQGCGKSLAAKAVAGDWGLPLLRLDLGALFAGSEPPEPMLRAAMRSAEAMAPCVLWVDEIEKGFPPGDASTTRLLGTLLTWLQEKVQPVFFIATANEVESLPPELLRRGRFDEIFFVDLPDLEARRQILAIHLGARGRDASTFDLTAVAQSTANFSGAELEQVVSAALYSAFAAGHEVTQADLVTAARELIPLFALREVEVKALRTWARDRARPAGHDRSIVDLFGAG